MRIFKYIFVVPIFVNDMSHDYDTVQMRVKRVPTWVELTNIKIQKQLEIKGEVSYDDVINFLLEEHHEKKEEEAR